MGSDDIPAAEELFLAFLQQDLVVEGNRRTGRQRHHNGFQRLGKTHRLARVRVLGIHQLQHADDFVGEHIVAPLRPYDLPTPDSPYGANKCMIEALGRYYAHAKDLEVICIRFGGVNRDDQPPASPPSERQVWFSQQDCASLIASCLQAENIPNGFAIVYGISANDGLVQDLSNPFGWEPNDGST